MPSTSVAVRRASRSKIPSPEGMAKNRDLHVNSWTYIAASLRHFRLPSRQYMGRRNSSNHILVVGVVPGKPA